MQLNGIPTAGEQYLPQLEGSWLRTAVNYSACAKQSGVKFKTLFKREKQQSSADECCAFLSFSQTQHSANNRGQNKLAGD